MAKEIKSLNELIKFIRGDKKEAFQNERPLRHYWINSKYNQQGKIST